MGLFDRLLILLKSPWAARLASVAVPLVFLAVVLVTQTGDVIDAYRTERPSRDFDYFRNAGRLITSDRASQLYDTSVDRDKWSEEEGYRFPSAYPYAPGAALLSAPLAQVSRPVAVDIWKGAIGVSSVVLAVIVASAFRSWAWRLAIAAAVFMWQPLLLNLTLGQTGAFVGAVTAPGFYLFLRNRHHGAVALAVLALKPTAAMPAALAVFPQRFEVWLRFIVPAAFVVLLPFLWLGPASFLGWMDILTTRGSLDLTEFNPYDHGLTGMFEFGRAAMYAALALGLVVVFLLAQRVYERLGLAASCAFAVACGLILNPHSMMYDWTVAFVAVYLLRRAGSLGFLASDLPIGLAAFALFFAGQWSAANIFSYPTYLPLPLWASAVAGWLAVQSLWPAGPEAMAALSRRLSIGVNARPGG